jgi:O-methyltransferase
MDSVSKIMFDDGREVDLMMFQEYQRPKADMIDSDPLFLSVYLKTVSFTMSSSERIFALYNAVKFITATNVPGDIVECGVASGGSCMIAALTLKHLNRMDKDIYLYDTFSGMSKPTEKDKPIGAAKQLITKTSVEIWEENQKDDGINMWCFASLEKVQQNLLSTGYPDEKLRFVKGKVEDTIPNTIPSCISILRIDTDWYESTYHSLTHLYPLLSVGGVIIFDDYSFWEGSKEAVDQYFSEQGIKLLLHRIDNSGYIAIKTQQNN